MNPDTGSFEEVALKYIDVLYRVAVGLCGSGSDADDLVQDTFLKAFEKFEMFEQGTSCKSWLLTILRNTWIDLLRHQHAVGKVVSLEEDVVDQTHDINEDVSLRSGDLLGKFSDDQIINALKKLPYEQRLTLLLIDIEQMSQTEAAEITGVAVGTVKSRASRGRMKLKKILESYAKNMGLMKGEK